MEPNTMLPPEALCKGYGLRDEALDELLMTGDAREVTLQYRSAIKTVQEALSSDTRIRIIALADDEEQRLSSHLAWLPLWSNRDTCVLIADPFEPLCRYDLDYLIPLGFAEHFACATARYPYYLPATSPVQLWPSYLDCRLISLPIAQFPHSVSSQDSDEERESTMFALILEVLQRLRATGGDHLLIEHQLTGGVVYNHVTRLFEVALAELPTAESPWLLSFVLIDAARSVATLANTDFLTWMGFTSLADHARERLHEFEPLAAMVKPNWRILDEFDHLCQSFASVRPQLLRDPSATNALLGDLLRHAGITSGEDRTC
jgi:hypothetical protein